MSTNQQTLNTHALPPLQYPKSIPLVALALAFAVFLGINIILMPLLGMEPIQNEDEAGAVAALVTSLAVSLAAGIVAGVLGCIYLRKQARAKHEELCNGIRAAHARAEEEKAAQKQREAAAARRREEEEAERRIYEECEFCGGELEFSVKKGQTHERSYSDGYTLEVKTDTTGIIRENRKNYYLTTGTDIYRCPHCHYTVEIKHEEFNGLIRSNTDIAVYGCEDEMPITREQVRAGRLCSAFNIRPSQILY